MNMNEKLWKEFLKTPQTKKEKETLGEAVVAIVEEIKERLYESAETIGADINEIWFAYLAAGSNWGNVGDGATAAKQLDDRIQTLKNSEREDGQAQEYIDIQKGRAAATLQAVNDWISGEPAFNGNIVKSYWTAREGSLAAAVNEGVPPEEQVQVNQAGSGGNPTDVALRLSSGDLLGVSLKSTGLKSGKISFKAGGFNSTIKRLEDFGVNPDYSAGDEVLNEKDWAKVKQAAVKRIAADLPVSLLEDRKKQSNKVRKQFVQMLQYFGLPEDERDTMLLRKYRNQDKVDKKKEEFATWAQYLQRLIPADELGGGTFEDYAKKQYQEQKDLGNRVLQKGRDIILDGLNQLEQDERLAFIRKEYINATAITPYWIKATGSGNAPPFSATVKDPYKDPKYKGLSGGNITFEPVASGTIGVKAGEEKIIKIRVKWESAPVVTSVKIDVVDW